MPTTAYRTYSLARIDPLYPDEAETLAVGIGPSLTLAQGSIMGQKTADGLYYPYVVGNADGTQIPKGILQYAVVTDASSNVTFGTTGGGGPMGETYPTAPIYYCGDFLTAELVQAGAGAIDANAVTVLQGHLTHGTIVSGALHIG